MRSPQVRRPALYIAGAIFAFSVVPSAANAAEQPRRQVSEGNPTSASYDSIVGVFPTHAPAEPSQCITDGGCDVIPLSITAPDPSDAVDTLLSLRVSWDGGDGNTLNAALFSPDDAVPPTNRGRNQIQGLVKWTTGSSTGELVLRAANTPTGLYQLTISNATGENRGYKVTADLSLHRTPNDPRSPSGSSEKTVGLDTADASGIASGSGAPVTEDSATRLPDQRFDGATGMVAGSPAPDRSLGLSLILVLLAAGLLCVVIPWSWRAWRPGAGRSRFRDLRLFWKLMTPFVLVIVIVGVVGTFLTSRYLADRADGELDRRLVQGSAAASGYLRDQEFTLVDASRFAANVEGVPEALKAMDASGAERALASVAAVNEDLDVIAAVAPDGRSLATLSRAGGAVSAHAGEEWSSAPPVRAALSGVVDSTGDKHAGLLRLADGTTVLVVAAPVRTDAVVGAVVVGRRTGPLTAEAAARSDGSVAMYDGTSSLIASSDGSAPGRLTQTVLDDEIRRDRTTVDERDVGRLQTALRLRSGRVGTLLVSIPAGSAADAVRSAALRLGLLVAVGLAAIMVIGALLSRYILRTVQPLLATNRALGRGELNVRAPVHGNDELGELAAGFNQMAEQLEASYQQLERRVAERTEELQHLYRAREEFYASVSHELRTPLFAILANTELLMDPQLAPKDPAEQNEFLSTVHIGAQQLVASVNDLLDLAKTETAAVRLNLSNVDPGAVLDEVTASLTALGRPQDVEVTLRRPRRVPEVTADRDRLVQILLNVGSNAVKYTPAGGRVTIFARADDDVLEFVVEDTGLGIPAEVGERIFEPYYVVDGTRGRGQPSTGLGLAITKRLVQAHGGTITFSSQPDAGTTFTVRIPVARGDTTAQLRPPLGGNP